MVPARYFDSGESAARSLSLQHTPLELVHHCTYGPGAVRTAASVLGLKENTVWLSQMLALLVLNSRCYGALLPGAGPQAKARNLVLQG